MNIGRTALAHFCAVLSGSMILMMGFSALILGIAGLIDGLAKWIGGLLIFVVLASVSIPFSLLLRLVIGKLPIQPLTGAILGGLGLSLALMLLLHPSTYPSLSTETQLTGLLVVHAMAGICAGWVFYRVEFSSKEAPIVG